MRKPHLIATTLLIYNLSFPVWGGDLLYRCTDNEGNLLFTDQISNCADRGKKSSKRGKTYSTQSNISTVKIYRFVDRTGVTHLTDQPLNSHYELIYEGNATLQPFSGGTYSALATLHRKYQDYQILVQEVATRTQVDAALLHAVIQAESAYNPDAVSPKGAVGLMQLMPGTAKRYGVTDSTDASENVDGGARYLKDLLALFSNDVSLAVAAYNAGENAVIRYGNQIPPYKETKHYVKTVLSLYESYKDKIQ